MKRRIFLFLLVLCPWLVRAEPVRQYPLEGTVRAVLSPEELVVAHEDIPNFMPAMTMAFDLAAPLPKGDVQAGNQIRALLVVSDAGMVLQDVVVVGSATDHAPRARPNKVPRLDEGDTVPEFALLDQNRTPRGLTTPERYTVLTFVFTRCPVPDFCPLMATKFAGLQRAIQAGETGVPVSLLSVTIDPEFDTPEQLAAYGEAVGADPAIWSHAVATPEVTDQIVRAFRVYRERNGALLDHTLCTALIDPQGKIVQVWRGNRWTRDDVVTAINAAAGGAQ
ncbi:MAG: electron transport protein SCO1/SenC [Puniceicoccaceae bacterium 5H]|nr:MAG: electron transport protein SCO1/SenC [Puniceicoccaceae bacterium 5H]